MREYAKVRSRFWTRGTGKKLPPLAKLVAQNLMSCQSGNMIGLYYLPVALLADETGLTREEALEALGKCLEEGFARYDHETSCVWVVNAAREQLLNEGEEQLKPTDNRVRGVEKLLKGLEDHPFYADFVNHYADILCIGKYVAPENPGRPRKAPSKPVKSPSRAPLEPVNSEQGAESSNSPATQEGERASAPPAAAPEEPAEPKLEAPPALPADPEAFSSGPYFAAFRETFASEAMAMGFKPPPEPHYAQLRAGARRAGLLARADGKPFAECAVLLSRAALDVQRATGKSAGLALLDVEPGKPPQQAARGGRLKPTHGTTHEDFAHAPSEQDQLAAVRAHRAARAANGT